MSKEIKEKTNKNNNKIYAIIVAVVAILALFIIFKPTSTPTTEQSVNIATPEQKEEKTVARIDITTPLVDADKPQFEVYVDDKETPLNQIDWMPKLNLQGYTVQGNSGSKNILIKSLNDADIDLVLRGPDKRNENGKFIPVWVKFTSIIVNGEEILSEATEVWHNKPYRYPLNAKAGEEYKIHAEWTKAETVPEK